MDSSSSEYIPSEKERPGKNVSNINNVHNRLQLNNENQKRKRKKQRRDMRVGTTEHTVCKKAFCSFHRISKHRVTSVAINLKNNNPTPEQDGRGSHRNRPNEIGNEIIAQIDEHIRSFPRRRGILIIVDTVTKKGTACLRRGIL
ncbi:hypothetical protein ILUMI_11453 [Ignelater luminosus]|uniref:Uncharacterized protein n=1 Tax=Ignelater luminosus TaxID=2038154 RepID=A0A8K0GD84_IGNLU|nr:hypothetical protein ILUMI_11453 [Ignelater luminosus]